MQPVPQTKQLNRGQRPATASQALKLLKRRHPKLLRRRSSSVTSNGSPMSVMSSQHFFMDKKMEHYAAKKSSNSTFFSNNKENGKNDTFRRDSTQAKSTEKLQLNNRPEKKGELNARSALASLNLAKKQPQLSPPPPPERKWSRTSGDQVSSENDNGAANIGQPRERAPTWEEEQAAVYMPSDQLVRVQCPHCSRKFAKEASKRHIAVCANTKNKPKAPPKQVAAFTDRLGVRRGGRGKLSCTFNEKAKVKSMLGASLQTDIESNKQTKKLENKPDVPKKKDTRERLSRLWGEIIFLLRKPIRNEMDLNITLQRASRGYSFLNDLERTAMELNILQGTLSRWLLPFNHKTSVADQAANNNNEFGSSELDGLLSYSLRRKLVNDATDLRSLIRVKIADDADLLQAKESLKHIMKFGRSLMRVAKKEMVQPYDLLKLL
eukprot:g3921.t1